MPDDAMDQLWSEILEEVDPDHNGEITFQEFSEQMTQAV